MVYVSWLADAARMTGYPVVESAGWRSRGHGGMTALEGVVLHHTAGPATGEMPSLGVIRDGRPALDGPLAHYGLGRSGTIYVVAAGLCYHAGDSAWAGFSGLNSRFVGIEAEDDGDGRWTAAQLDCYPRLVAACLYYMNRAAGRACSHKECALPAGRKVDPAGIDMPALRARVADMLRDPLNRIPREDVDVPLTQGEIDSIAAAVWNRGLPNWWGQTVPAALMLRTIEYRAYDTQEVRLPALTALVNQVRAAVAAGVDPAAITAAVSSAVDEAFDGLTVTSTLSKTL